MLLIFLTFWNNKSLEIRDNKEKLKILLRDKLREYVKELDKKNDSQM